MNIYSVSAGVACGSDLPIINVTGSASIRTKIVEWLIGFSTAPADVATLLVFERTTDAGTGGTALTEEPIDPLTVAASSAAVSGTFSTAPTDGNVLQRIAMNQRATHRWVASAGRELVATAAANNGIMLNSESSGATPQCDATIFFGE